MKFCKKIAGLVGLVITGAIAVALSAGVAEAKPVSDALKQEACEYMDDSTGPALGYTRFDFAVTMLRTEHSGMDLGTAAWAIIHGVQDVCDWHKQDVPAELKKWL